MAPGLVCESPTIGLHAFRREKPPQFSYNIHCSISSFLTVSEKLVYLSFYYLACLFIYLCCLLIGSYRLFFLPDGACSSHPSHGQCLLITNV